MMRLQTIDNTNLPDIAAMAERARAAAPVLATAGTAMKNAALRRAAESLLARRDDILRANQRDMEGAQDLPAAMRDRLLLNDTRVAAMARGLEDIAALPDPVGKVLASWTRPNGLEISRVSVPIGVIAVIFESRPNVAADAAGLCLKSGNVVILRGGRESTHSVNAIMAALQEGIEAAGLPSDIAQAIPVSDRRAMTEMLHLDRFIDLIVPRGGRGLLEHVARETRIPVLMHLDGICHTYIDAAADPDKARKIAVNAKMRRTGICGAMETLLVDRRAIAILPSILGDLAKAGCEIRGDAEVASLDPRVVPATDRDWETEYLDAILSVKIVSNVQEAVDHINRHGSHHTDAIVTEDQAAADYFFAHVDSAILIHNSSTQFADGGEFGLGGEIGISTGRLHARGPVGAAELTTYKYIVRGTGQIRP